MMKSAPASLLPPPIRAYLGALAERQRRLSLVRATGRAVAVVLLWMLLACAVDRLLPLPAPVRMVSLLASVGAVVWVLARPAWRWWRGDVDWIAASELAERLDPSLEQRLSTATSRLLGPSGYRGSTALLDQVVNEATTRVAPRDPTPLLPTRLALGPWAVAAGALVLTAALLPVSWVGLPRLLTRYVLPLSGAAPVTTTRLHVTPGTTNVEQGNPLMVNVRAERLGDAVPRIAVCADGKTWTRHLMTPGGAGFVFRFDPLSQDVRYRVTGGDAASDTFDIHVLRRPLVAEFRVHYVYPAYTNRPALTVSNRTGLIEAPVGSDATVTVIASEPLVAGRLRVGDTSLDLNATLDDHARQATVRVEKDAVYTVALTSDRGAVTDGPTRYAIRALADRPPLVRVLDPGDGARPGPRDLMPVAYQALDDYGVDAIGVAVRVNGGEPVRIPLKTRGDPRRQEETYGLDLAPLNVRVGDVVSAVVEASDGRKQSAVSQPLVGLVSPRAIDLNAHQRVIELEAAKVVADRMVVAWERAKGAADQLPNDAPPRGAPAPVALVSQANRGVSDAGEAAAVLRQSLFRATLRSRSNEMSVTLAALLDGAQLQLNASEALVGIRARREGMDRQLDDALQAARRTRDALATVATGERAAAAAAERENVAAATSRAADPAYPEVLKKGVERMARESEESVRSIGIDPGAGDVAEQLKRRVEAADALMRGQAIVDHAGASNAWAKAIAGPHKPTGFDARLITAAQAESIRPDADLVRARDVQLAAEAAGRIERNEVPPTTRPTDPLPRELYPASMLALQRYHETNRPMVDRPSSDDVEARQEMAKEARRRMTAWAGLGPAEVAQQSPDAARSADETRSAETLVAEASAAAAPRDYAGAAQIDRRLAKAAAPEPTKGNANRDPTDAPPTRAARTMAAAERIDRLAAQQQQLAERTKEAKADDSGQLAEEQAKLADEIGQAGQDARLDARDANDPDWRDEATAAIQSVQEQLASMPQSLAATARADAYHREAKASAATARRAAKTSPADRQPAAGRAADQADRDLAEAQAGAARAAEPVRPEIAEAMSSRLGSFVPQTGASVDAIDQQLLPALRAVAQAQEASDAASLERSSAQARRAIERVQAELAKAQDALIERDPLVAAKWFARAATESLKQRPPDLSAAERQQRMASTALTRAWDRSIHQAATERLAGVPSMASVFNLFPVTGQGEAGAGARATERILSLVPAAREWGRMRLGDRDATDAVRRDTDPPGYEEPIRLYFETLGKAKEDGK